MSVTIHPARVLTQRARILGVRRSWYDQYRSYIDGREKDSPHGDTHRKTYMLLCTLDLEACSKADVDAAIGNGSWTTLSCDACNRNDCDAVVEVGQYADYESRTATLCRVCAQEAADLIAKR